MTASLLATSQASLIVGVLSTIALLFFRCHRDEKGKTSPPKIVSSFLFGISVYTLTVLVVGHFWLDDMMRLIAEGFGEPRVAWLILGLSADGFARMYRLFDP